MYSTRSPILRSHLLMSKRNSRMALRYSFPTTVSGPQMKSPKVGATMPANHVATCRNAMSSIKYNNLIVQSYYTPEKFNILAAASLWTVLAGFVVFPSTFTSLQNSSSLSNSVPGRAVQRTIQNIPLLVMAIFFFVVGMIGVAWLWRQRRHQHLWVADRLFLYVGNSWIVIHPYFDRADRTKAWGSEFASWASLRLA